MISSTSNRIDYVSLSGNLGPYSFAFPVYNQSDLQVYFTAPGGTPVLKTISTDYTQTAVNVPGGLSGGSVTLINAQSDNTIITLIRTVPYTQQTSFSNYDKFDAKTAIEGAYDKNTMQAQQLNEVVSRSIQFPLNRTGLTVTIPDPAISANQGKFIQIVAGGIQLAIPTLSTFSNPLTTKGDLIVSQGGSTPARLPAGADALALITDSTQTSGVAWKDGSILPGVTSVAGNALPNLIINGNMDVWQRGTAFTSVGNGVYTADRWKYRAPSTTAVINVNKSSNVPSVAQSGFLFANSLEIDVTTGDSAVAGADLAFLEHDIEGYNWHQLAQRPLTLSFWVSDTVTGVHYVALANTSEDGVNNINIILPYTVNSADTWEYKTLNFVASPSSGTWNYTTGIGLRVKFILMAGTNWTGATENQWNGGGSQVVANNAPNTNSLSSASNFYRLTGVRLDTGSVAQPIKYIPFEYELSRCQRYYEKSFDYETAPAQSTGTITGEWHFNSTVAGAVQCRTEIPFRVQKRIGGVGPTVTLYNPNAANAQLRNSSKSADFTSSGSSITGQNGFTAFGTGNASLAVGDEIIVGWTVDADL